MNEIFLSSQVIVFLLSESTLFALLIVAFSLVLKFLLRWDFEHFTPCQFALERQSYLVTTIILFVFIMKFILIVYFIFSIDALSLLVPGAMCAAGVITANEYGSFLLLLKLTLLFFLTLWFYLHYYDNRTKNYLWFKQKAWLFSFIFLLFILELLLDFAYFSHIDTHIPVSCCSTLFGQLEGANPLPFGLNISMLLLLFYLLYTLVILTLKNHQPLLYIIANILFVYISYYAVVYFFGTYIYELPTHKCPFCMMQAEYAYVGYVVWGSLYIATYMGISNAVMALLIGEKHTGTQVIVTYLLSLFVLLCTAYVTIYYVKNGVLL